MNKIQVINELIVNIFDKIMMTEEKTLRTGMFSDLSITEFHTIDAIGYSSLTMSELAKKLNITVGTLTTAINRLVKKSYVIRKRLESDRRIVKVSLDKKGELAYKEHEQYHIRLVKEMIKNLDDADQEIIIKSLSKINKFLGC